MQDARHTLTQVSTIGALLNGLYDGDVSLSELLTHGDFGIGTFDHLDGEMVLLDGTFYQIKGDGTVGIPDLALTTPFAVATWFAPSERHPVSPGTTFSSFEIDEDARLPTKNIFHAIQLTGSFSAMTCRSVPRQSKPYPSLAEVAQREAIFSFANVSGTIIGFRCPQFVAGLNLPGYHLHFISDDRKSGGHVLEFTVSHGEASVDYTPGFSMLLPHSEAFYSTDMEACKHTELDAIERGVPEAAHVVRHR